MVTPTKAEMTMYMAAEAETVDGKKIDVGLTNIGIRTSPQRIFGDAVAKLVRVDIKKRGEKVGYIMGAATTCRPARRSATTSRC
jgi:hypothetical protein